MAWVLKQYSLPKRIESRSITKLLSAVIDFEGFKVSKAKDFSRWECCGYIFILGMLH